MNTTRMGLAIFFFLAPSFAAAAMRTVAVSDHQPPGTPLGSTFDAFGFSPPVINNQGQVAFRSTIDNAAGFSDDVGIWSESGGSLVKVGFEGDPAPGTKAD